MKKQIVLVILTLALVVTSACSFTTNFGNGKGTRGSGNVVTEERTVGDFTAISLQGAGELIIEQGDTTALTIEADDNLMDDLISEVRGDTLVIGYEEGTIVLSFEKIIFHLTVKDLDRIDVAGAGSVKTDSLKAKELDLTSSGAGNFDMSNLQATSVNVEIGGLANFELSGQTDALAVEISGSGQFDGKDLASKTASVTINGLGNADVRASDTLDVSINGGGNVTYYGNPQVSQSISGMGNVKKGE